MVPQNNVAPRGGLLSNENKKALADQGESTVVMAIIIFCALSMYVIGHDWVSKHMTGLKDDETGTVVGNFPLRMVEKNDYDTFDQTSMHQKRAREAAMREFMRIIYGLAEKSKLDAEFSTETGDKANWWNRMYSIANPYADGSGITMPISFMLCATDQNNKSKFVLAGGVTSIVLESEKDFLDPATSGTSFKLYATLRDFNWENRDDPDSPDVVKYIFTQTAKGHGTSVVMGSDGRTLPIFVNFFGLRLEHEAITMNDDIIGRFKTEGVRMEVNEGKRLSVLNKPVSSVRFHENTGEDLIHIMRMVDRVFTDKFEYARAIPDESDGTFIHRLSAREGEVLPVLLRVGERATPIVALTASTACDESDTSGMDLVLDVWVRMVTGQVVQLVGPRATRDWKMMDPAVSEEEKKRLVKFTVDDSIDLILLSNNVYDGNTLEIPKHSVRSYTPFNTLEYPGGVSYDIEKYNVAQYVWEDKPVYNVSLDKLSDQNWETVGEYSVYAYAWIALFIICTIVGSFVEVSKEVFKITSILGKLGVAAGIGVVATGIHMMYRERFDLSHVINYLIPGCTAFIALGLLVQMMSMSTSGAPSGRSLVALVMGMMVFSMYIILTGGVYEFSKKDVVDDDVMTEKSYTFYLLTTLMIASGLGVLQMGAILHAMRCNDREMTFGSPWLDMSTIQVIAQSGITILFLWLANYRRVEDTEEIDPSGMDFQRTIFAILTVGALWAWTERDRFGTEMHKVHYKGHGMDSEPTMFFFGKYALLLGAIYIVVSRMVQSSLLMDDENQMCILKRRAMENTLDEVSTQEVVEPRDLRSFITDQLSKHGCVTHEAKEPIIVISSMVVLMIIMANSGSARHSKTVDVTNVFMFSMVACMTGAVSAWLCDPKKQQHLSLTNPVYVMNKGKIVVDEWSLE